MSETESSRKMIYYSEARSAAASGATAVDNAFILEYMAKAPANCIKVYLFALMQYKNPSFMNEDIAAALSITDKEVADAFDYWQRVGLIRILTNDPMQIEFCGSNVSAVYVSSAAGRYTQMLSALREVLGTRNLSATDTTKIYDWVEVYGLSEDTVVLLVAHCIEIKGRSVSVRYMDAVARAWADEGILNADEAKKHISEQNESIPAIREIKKRWRLSRNLSDDEIALYRKWRVEWGIPHEVIMMACEDMVSASNPNFAYLDGILSGYRQRGTIDEKTLAEYRNKRLRNEEFTRQLFKNAGLKTQPSSDHYSKVAVWLDDWHISLEALLSLSTVAQSQTHPFSYMAKVAESWHERNIRSGKDAQDDLNKSKESGTIPGAAPKAKNTTAMAYPQRKYSESDLKALGIDFGGVDDDENT